MRRLRATAYFAAGIALCFTVMTAIHAVGAVPRSYSPYRKLKLFTRVLSYVENNYVEFVDDRKLIYGAIGGMLNVLDPHSIFMPPDQYRQLKADTQGEFFGIGIEVEIRKGWITVISPIEGSPAHQAGLKSGDQIVEIEGKSTADLPMHQAVRIMRGPRGSRVKIAVKRAGAKKPIPFEITRDVIKIVSVTSKRLPNNIGYIRIKSFQEQTHEALGRALKELNKDKRLAGLILDLRNNPGGLLSQAIRVSDFFIDRGLIVTTRGQRGVIQEAEKAHRSGTYKNVPITCIVNEGSASAAEIVAGALQDHKRAVILGSSTFGKGSVQQIIELDDGSALKLTVARYYTPKGRSIQEHGIQPDIIVQATAPASQKKRGVRERDLRGHLRNPKAAGKNKVGRSRLKDFQLQTAIDHLHAAQIFNRHLFNKKTADEKGS
jgi:carboxyl-terminal processing protease